MQRVRLWLEATTVKYQPSKRWLKFESGKSSGALRPLVIMKRKKDVCYNGVK